MATPYPSPVRPALQARARRHASALLAFPELVGLLFLTAILNLWNLLINGWANTYYSAAVRSMTTSWHDFLFASLDRSGLMTVDKPPLSLWVQALSARVFGFHPLSLLVPQAMMGVAAVALVYDLTRRRFGRIAGFVSGLALATTPIAVAVARHNNPDELLMLCSVAAVWCALRAIDTGRTRWLVLSGVWVGLGFETKMGVALLVVPGIAAAWLWLAPRGRIAALRQLLAGGAAMVAVGGAWPLLVALTPASQRPWISGTSDNSILSLILGYNGLGRVAGQAGGPQGLGGGVLFGGATGPFRLLDSGLGDQAGWLFGLALVAAVGLGVLSRLRRRDPRTGWLIVVGGAAGCTAAVFSFAHGIFHPYYVSLLAPFIAALVGAGVGEVLVRDRRSRLFGPLAIAGGVISEVVVLGGLGGQLTWARALLIMVGAGCAVVLAARLSSRARGVATGLALVALLAAPAAWAAETLGHATNGTFPAGGPASASAGGFGGARGGAPGGAGFGAAPGPGFGAAPGGGPRSAAPGGARPQGGPPPGGAGPGFGGHSTPLPAAMAYASAHGGGTIGVASQSSAASAIMSSNANVAGLGGFSGRESSVTVRWLAEQVHDGHLRWILAESNGFGAPGDTRSGSSAALASVARTCRAVTLSNGMTMYDCQGRAAALLSAAG